MGLPLARTLTRMDRLHKSVEQGAFPHPVIVSRVRDRSDNYQVFVRFVQQRYPRFGISIMPYASWAGQIEDRESLPIPPTGCSRWFELSIMSTGQVALCCMDGEGRHVIGDVSTAAALDVYNHSDYRRLRQDAISRLDARAPCTSCSL